MSFHDSFDDRKTQSAAARGFPCRISLIEPVEDQRQMLGRNTWTAIAHAQPHSVRNGHARQRDLAAIGRVPQRVRGQILQRLLQTIGIARSRSRRQVRR